MSTDPMSDKPVTELTDDELFDELRKQVNHARGGGNYQRDRTREIAAEMKRRGWANQSPAPRPPREK